MPPKPIEHGLRFHVVVDHGYVWNFHPRLNKEGPDPAPHIGSFRWGSFPPLGQASGPKILDSLPLHEHHAQTQVYPQHPHTHPHRQVRNMNNRGTPIKSALEAIENGAFESKAAKVYNIPCSTLRNRRALCTLRPTNQHRLSSEQVDELCGWIIEQGVHGYAPSHNGFVKLQFLC